ncbi:MAG: GTPase RsgA, partial [Veillonellales bacterium]
LVSGDLRRDGKGRHTTTRREMFILPGGGIVIDTPGMRELALEGANMASAFADITELSANCRFSNCSHEQEPDCAVLQAVADGRLSAARLNSWRKLRQESRYADMNSRQIEEEKLSVMFAAVGGRKNARRLMKNANRKRRF